SSACAGSGASQGGGMYASPPSLPTCLLPDSRFGSVCRGAWAPRAMAAVPLLLPGAAAAAAAAVAAKHCCSWIAHRARRAAHHPAVLCPAPAAEGGGHSRAPSAQGPPPQGEGPPGQRCGGAAGACPQAGAPAPAQAAGASSPSEKSASAPGGSAGEGGSHTDAEPPAQRPAVEAPVAAELPEQRLAASPPAGGLAAEAGTLAGEAAPARLAAGSPPGRRGASAPAAAAGPTPAGSSAGWQAAAPAVGGAAAAGLVALLQDLDFEGAGARAALAGAPAECEVVSSLPAASPPLQKRRRLDPVLRDRQALLVQSLGSRGYNLRSRPPPAADPSAGPAARDGRGAAARRPRLSLAPRRPARPARVVRAGRARPAATGAGSRGAAPGPAGAAGGCRGAGTGGGEAAPGGADPGTGSCLGDALAEQGCAAGHRAAAPSAGGSPRCPPLGPRERLQDEHITFAMRELPEPPAHVWAATPAQVARGAEDSADAHAERDGSLRRHWDNDAATVLVLPVTSESSAGSLADAGGHWSLLVVRRVPGSQHGRFDAELLDSLAATPAGAVQLSRRLLRCLSASRRWRGLPRRPRLRPLDLQLDGFQCGCFCLLLMRQVLDRERRGPAAAEVTAEEAHKLRQRLRGLALAPPRAPRGGA
ncbi:unnamed protein product, partial [Prorocentrum cordatum]